LLHGSVFKTFEGCGHYLHNERPEAFAQTVREFLDNPDVPATELRLPASAPAARRRRPGKAHPAVESAAR
jgi:hypothetical protein